MALIAKKVSISDDKALDDLIKRAEEIKKEHSNLKREAAKEKSQAMAAKLAAKEEQLKRVADAIRAKRAEAHSSVSLVVDAYAGLDIVVLNNSTGEPTIQVKGRNDLVSAFVDLLKKDLKNKVSGTDKATGGILMTFKDVKLPELSTKAEDAKERVLNNLGDAYQDFKVPVKGKKYKVDWDGPSVVEVISVSGKEIYIQRVEKGVLSKHPADRMLVSPAEFSKMYVGTVSDASIFPQAIKVSFGRDLWLSVKDRGRGGVDKGLEKEVIDWASKYIETLEKSGGKGKVDAGLTAMAKKLDLTTGQLINKLELLYADYTEMEDSNGSGRLGSYLDVLVDAADYDKSTTVKITSGRDEWWVTKVDTTHVEFVNDPKYIGKNGMGVSHINQHRGKPYYEDLRSWLKGGKSPDGKTYAENDSVDVSIMDFYSYQLLSWFTGTAFNTVEHPEFGKQKVTLGQIVKSPTAYRTKLNKELEKAVKSGDVTLDMIKKNGSLSDWKPERGDSEDRTYSEQVGPYKKGGMVVEKKGKKPEPKNDMSVEDLDNIETLEELQSLAKSLGLEVSEETGLDELRELIRTRLSETEVADAASGTTLKGCERAINWGTEKTMPLSQGEAVKAVIKQYKIAAKEWGYGRYNSSAVIGVGTDKQRMIWKDNGSSLSFVGIINKDGSIADSSSFMDAVGYGALSPEEAAMVVDIEEDGSFLRRNVAVAKSLEKKGYISIGAEGTSMYEAELTKRGVQWLKEYNAGKFDEYNFGTFGGVNVTVGDDGAVIIDNGQGRIRITGKKWVKKLIDNLNLAIKKM